MQSRSLKPVALTLLLSASLLPAISVGVSAQSTVSAEAAAPVFTQAVPNVFRRFAVDLAKMKEFYGDVLGLEPLPTLNMPGGGQMTRFHAGASEIKLQASAGETQAPAGGVRDATGLRVLTFFFPDEAALAARFKEHGYPAPEFRNRTTSSGTARVAMVRDPSHQWVEAVVVPGAPAETYERLEIGLTVADVETSRAFYRGFVGLEELKPVEDPLLGATKYPFRMGTTTINVWSFGKGLPANRSSAGIQYVVGNVDAIDARAKAKGIKIDRPLSDFTAALRTVWMSDPDGITNYFAQVARRTPPSGSTTR
jgi:catechol 2,3-dioxygenase-like lactoylglutathione lyase family enzyme